MPAAATSIALAQPTLADATGIHQLIADTGVLDVNSLYAYLLICRDFAATSVVAREDDLVVGVITGYIPPSRPHALFVWQAAVADSARGLGLAGRMLDDLVNRLGDRIHALETTVSPSNRASRRFFEKFAARRGAAIHEDEGFPASLFPDGNHEAEPRLVIGPLRNYEG